MSLRSRAFLTGMAKGFFQSNNERRAKMAERMQQLATNRAEMDRERAKSRASAVMKEAQAEESKITALRAAGHLEQDSLEYTEAYWNDQTRDIWKESQFGSQQEFIEKYYKQNRPTAFKREFKGTSEIQRNLSDIEKAIQMRQSEEMNRSVSTPLDRLLSFGTLKEEGASTIKVPELDAKSTQGPVDTFAETGGTIQRAEGDWDVTPFRNAIEAESGQILGNVFTFTDGTETKNMQRQADGSWKEVNVTSRPTTEEGERLRDKTPKLNKVQEEGLVRYDRNDRVQLLATELAANEYKGNPVAFAQRNLSVIKDVIGSSIGMTGNHSEDLAAITAYMNEQIDAAGLANELGKLDAAAIIKGDIEANTKFLIYATANMFHEGDRITVAAKETAEEVIDSFIFGTATHDARLMSLAKQAQSEMSRTTGNNLSSIRNTMDHPLWNSYPRIKEAKNQGLDFISSISGGMSLGTKIKGMKTSNPKAYKATIESMIRNLGTNDLTVLEEPVFVHPDLGTPVVIMFNKGKNGELDFGLVPIN